MKTANEPKSPNWDDLRTLLAALRAGTFSAAGRMLGINETTIARRITSLEQTLSARLFERTPDGLRATGIAQALLPELERAEAAMLAVTRRVQGTDTRLTGFVRITASDVLVTEFLMNGLDAFLARHPDIRIELFGGYDVLDVARQEADIAIRSVMPQQPQLVRRWLGDVATAIYAAPDYLARHPAPSPEHGLAGHDLIGFSALLTPTPAINLFHGISTEGARYVLTGNNLIALMRAAENGLGLVTLPCYIADHREALVRVWPQQLSSYPLWAVFHRDLRHTARIRAVVDHICALFETNEKRLSGLL